MSSTHDLITCLKAELKAAGLTYADVARGLGMAESSVKRMFSRGEMPLSRVDEVLRLLRLDFADVARKVADAQPLRSELTAEQERAVVADRRLLLVAICVLSQWSLEQIIDTYRLTPPECRAYFAVLERLGVLDRRPQDRYRLRIDKTFRWRPDGPVMQYFREHVSADYFSGAFDGEGELLQLVHGQFGHAGVAAMRDRLGRIAHDFAQQHVADQRLPDEHKEAYTLVIGLRSWLFSAFRELMREDDKAQGTAVTSRSSPRPDG